MIYRLHRLDGRHSHHDRFQYYLGFSTGMADRSGPLHFNDAMAWCVQTWGWSAEVNQTARILCWTQQIAIMWIPNAPASGISGHPPDHCNPSWSWSNQIQPGLRIYLRDDAELSWFQLAHPVDQ